MDSSRSRCGVCCNICFRDLDPREIGGSVEFRISDSKSRIFNYQFAVRIIGIIPARYASTRFPAKAIAPIAGKPLVQHVVEQCKKASSLAEVVVATDDERIASVCRGFCALEMTRPEHPSGTDRIAEAAARRESDAMSNIE